MKWFSGVFLLAVLAFALPARAEAPDTLLRSLAAEAAENNADIQAARREVEAARNRVSPAAALDDPMLELGVVNLPAESLSFRKEDMTMKMIGLTQRLPYPGKRALRRDVAEKEVEAAENNLQEAVNRVQREVKMAYFDLGQVDEMQRLVEKNRRILEQLLSIAETRYGVGQTSQADVLKAQTQVSKMLDELIKLGRERPMIEAELNRALGRSSGVPALAPPLRPREVVLQLAELRAAARQSRPQLLAQQSMIARSTKQLDLARKDYYPDFDVRFSYGQRDNTVEMKREDMISFTVAINLPVWRGSKLEPRVSEAEALREQASRMYQARLNEIDAMLRREVANAEQSLKSVRLYETGILPQARLAVEAALSAYRVGRTDFLMLLDSQMTVFNYEQSYISNVASQNKALAEIEFLTGKTLF
ncbi:MAG: TolC family protein [Betaproteobacteria bacterium]|nr:MAG: TolC family protein [Betaproteobacteria bacterium]